MFLSFLLIISSIKVNALFDLELMLEIPQYQMMLNLLNSMQKQAEQREQEAGNHSTTINNVFPEPNNRFSLTSIT